MRSCTSDSFDPAIDRPDDFAPLTRAAQAMAQAGVPWGFAGGWAIDLSIGKVGRPHGDIDIAVFRDDQTALYDSLSGWDWSIVRDGQAQGWRGHRLQAPVHELRARRQDGFELEFLLNERDGPRWRYRRDPRVTAAIDQALVKRGHYPALALEIVLLFKSKHLRPKDHTDFAAASPLLSAGARQWLRSALALTHPHHAWISALQ
jgi:hypothetical protein